VQSFVKAKDNGEHLSAMVSSLRQKLAESNAEKRHLHHENKSLRARLDEIDRNDKARAVHGGSVEKDKGPRESMHSRLSGHGMDATDNPSQPHHTSLLTQHRSHIPIMSSAGSDRSAGERNLVAAEVCQTQLKIC